MDFLLFNSISNDKNDINLERKEDEGRAGTWLLRDMVSMLRKKVLNDQGHRKRITQYARQQERHRCIEQSFGLYGRGRGQDDMREWH